MTNKLVVVINSLKVSKIKKILLYAMKLQLPQEPLTKGLPPPDPRSLCPLSSTEYVETPLQNKIPGYATALHEDCYIPACDAVYSRTEVRTFLKKCSVHFLGRAVLNHEDGGSNLIRNIITLLSDYKASHIGSQ